MTVQDGSVMCLPTCSGGTACPAFGGHAQPSCVLNDGMGDQLCGLVCGSDSDCDFDGGAKCEAVQGESGPVNLCVYGWKSFWAWHVLQAAYTGAANKNLGDEKCDVGFVADYCFGQDPLYSKNNAEEHIDGNVIEYLQVGSVQRVSRGGCR